MRKFSFEIIRRWSVIISFVFVASVFWGFVAAAAVQFAFDIVPGQTLIFVGLPVAVLMGIYLTPKMLRSLKV